LGRKLTEEEKEARRQFALKQWQNPEHRRRVSEALRGHPVSEETREKLRSTRIGIPLPPRTVKKMVAATLAKPNVEVVCENCGITFEARKKFARFCSSECRRFFTKWKNKPNTTCVACGKPFFVYPYRLRLGRGIYCSYECMADGYKGDNPNPRDMNEAKWWRGEILKKDGYKCQECGITKRLIAHHILPYQYFPELLVDLNNGMVLCKKHHRKKHKMIQKIVAEITESGEKPFKEVLRKRILEEESENRNDCSAL